MRFGFGMRWVQLLDLLILWSLFFSLKYSPEREISLTQNPVNPMACGLRNFILPELLTCETFAYQGRR
jgi:hypothetical protein